MKKTFLNIALLATLAITGNGCKKFLDERPLQEVEVDKYFKSTKDITAAMAGVYASFQLEMTGGGTGSTWGKYIYWGEGRADNYDRTQYNFSHAIEIASNGLSSGNQASNWTGLFRTIGRANNCIKYIPQVPKFDRTATKSIVDGNLAQSYAMRAMCYFWIVRIWGDAPIWLEPYTDIAEEPKRARESRDKIMDEIIIKDLEKAYELIPKNATPSQWYIGEGAICAMLADVYMWRKDYPNAMIWFNNLFKAKAPTGKVFTGASAADLATQANWKSIFLAGNSIENIWSIHWDFTVNGCACLPNSIYHSNSPLQIDSAVMRDWAAIQATDFRARQTVDFAASLRDRMQKYYAVAATGNPTWNDASKQLPVYLVMYRLTDMMLLYAEAANKLADRATALKWLNIVRVRAGLPAYLDTDPAVATEAAMENALLNERRWELFGEGKRWFDLVRTEKVQEVMDPVLKLRQTRQGVEQVGFGTDNRKYLWPVFRTLIENNPLLKQNLPYN